MSAVLRCAVFGWSSENGRKEGISEGGRGMEEGRGRAGRERQEREEVGQEDAKVEYRRE